MPRSLFAAAVVLIGVTLPFASAATDQGDVAKVDGHPISVSQLNLMVHARQINHPSAGQRHQMVQALVDRQLLADQAHKLGLDKKPHLEAELASARDTILAQAAFHHYLQQHPITGRVLHQHYREELHQLSRHQYKVRAIVLHTEQEAQHVRKSLKAGRQFAKIAAAHSRLSTKQAPGGELGWRFAKSFLPPVAAAIRKAKKDAPSEPIWTPQGWWIIETQGKRATRHKSYKKAKTGLRQQVERVRLQHYLKQLRKQAHIEIEKAQ